VLSGTRITATPKNMTEGGKPKAWLLGRVFFARAKKVSRQQAKTAIDKNRY